jgi:hypothetical protein
MITEILAALLIILMLLYLNCSSANKEYFTLSKKPMDHDWNTVGENPFDNVDYQTPVFIKY